MLNKKLVATVLTATMIIGSCVTVMADEASSATGAGSSYDHVNKEVITVTYPTTTAVATAFNFVVDPERLVNAAGGKLGDATEVTANPDGVYFKDSKEAASTEVEIEGKNSIDVDLSVAVTVTADDKAIALVADETELAAATDPALLLKVKVGTDEQVITADGATAKDKIAGVSANFVVQPDGNGQYEYVVSPSASGWNKVGVQLIGKTNEAEVPEGAGAMTAPTVELTWTAAKHVDGPIATPSSMSTAVKSATISGLADASTLQSAKVVKIDDSEIALTASTQYTYNASTGVFAIVNGKEVLLDSTKYKKFVLTFSGSQVVEIPIVAAN